MTFTKLLPLFLLFTFCSAFSQNTKDSIPQNKTEKTNETLVDITFLAKTERDKELVKIKNNKLFREQNKNFKAIINEIQNGNVILKKGIDYKIFSNEFKIISDWKKKTTEGISQKSIKNHAFRDLTTTSILLDELLSRTVFWLQKIQNNNTILIETQSRLDSIASEESLYIIPTDSASKVIYTERFKLYTKDLKTLDTKLTNALDSIQTLQIEGNRLKYLIEKDIVNYNLLRKTSFENMSKNSINIFKFEKENKKTFSESLSYSFSKGIMVFTFYLINHYAVFLLMTFFCIGIIFYLKQLKKKYIQLDLYQTIKNPIVIFNYPIATSIVLTTTIFQVIIPSPPFVIVSLVWLSTILAISYIVYKSQLDRVIYKTWFLFLPILFIAIQDNLILLHTITEFWIIILLSSTTSIFCIYAIKKRKEINSRFIFYVMCFCLFLSSSALFFLINGNYDLGKISILNGIYTIFILISSLYAYYLIDDILIFSNFLKESDEEKQLSTLTTKDKKAIPRIFYVIFFIVWFLTTKRNNYSFESLLDPIIESFNETRQIGDFSFSYMSIFLFIFILFSSGVIAKIVSFLAADTKSHANKSKSSGLGSWLLLIRIAIICIGVLIAFASAGIPLDKITLIISALGVGIGFGLQTLINNLVSGLIIAFEKPINLEDIIEVNGQIGTMKSIGIRSSVITTWDGADVIIPNGDLLSNQLTNWTVGSHRRRFEIQVGVAYGSNLKRVKEILIEILNENELVLKNPAPMIWVTKFNDSSIDYSIKYWVPHFNFGNDVRSELLITIDEAFKENGIEIPFPQTDVHLQLTNNPEEEDLKL